MALPPALIQRFRTHLGEVHDEVVALAATLKQAGSTGADDRERLRVIAHQLAGTAEGYGFPLVGERARHVEAALSNADAGLVAHVQTLADALADASREGSV